MKYLNKFSIVAFLCIVFTAVSSSAYCAVISTPLDGGLLTVLGAAGVSYYLVRKKKKNSAEN
jgi:hypothetical protein